jgi:phosphate uptake regulator
MNMKEVTAQTPKNGEHDTSPSGDDRYVRRVQVTGRGSYIVSLPKPWVEEAGLRKGGRVEFSKQENWGLTLTPFGSTKFDDERARCTVSLTPNVDPGALTRMIISLYVVGYSTIEIKSKSGNLAASTRDTIRDVARGKLVGTELVTESAQSATLQVLLNYPQLLVPDALRRMLSILGAMIQDSMQALFKIDKESASQVVKIDDEIDRFSLYVIRQLKWAVKHPTLLSRIGLASPVECLGYRIIAKSVERSADHATRIASSVLLLQQPPNAALLKDATALSQLSLKMMETALRACFAGDYRLAEGVLLEGTKVPDLESKLVDRLLREKMSAGDLSAMRLVSESLRRIGEYATDVAEVVLNSTVQKMLDPAEALVPEATKTPASRKPDALPAS